MTNGSKKPAREVVHSTFTIEKRLKAPPAKVFQAFADQKKKAQWFKSPEGWVLLRASLDFRVGGVEVNDGGPKGGWVSRYHARYVDIIENERILLTYEMHIDDAFMSASLLSIELEPDGSGTKLTLVETGAYVDQFVKDGPAGREEGTKGLMDQLAAYVDG